MTNPVLVHVCLLAAGASFGTGLFSGAAHHGSGEDDYYLPYAVTCLMATAVFLALASLYGAQSFAASVAALHWHIASVALVMPALVWLFSRIAHRPAARREMLGLCIGSGIILVANALWPASLHFDSIAPTTPVPGSGRDMYYFGRGGWITVAYHAWHLVPIALCFVNGLHIWRQRDRALGALALASATVLLVANLIATRADYMGGRPAYFGGVVVLVTIILLLGMALGLAHRRQGLALLASSEELREANARLGAEIARRSQLEQHFVESQRLEALGLMAAGVAHDVNNVLAVVGGHAEIMRRHLPPGGEDERGAEAIGSAVARGASLTRKLLAFARCQDLAPAAVEPDGLLTESRALLSQMAGPATALVFELEAEGQPIFADPSQFTQVIMNLAVNARDAMPAGGRLTIRTRTVRAGAPGGCACEGALRFPHVAIEVTDTGCGIDPEILPRIFEPFFTTKPPDKGTGLGLATVHGIVKQSGAHLAVSSRPGEGARFRLCWPGAHQEVAAQATTGLVRTL